MYREVLLFEFFSANSSKKAHHALARIIPATGKYCWDTSLSPPYPNRTMLVLYLHEIWILMKRILTVLPVKSDSDMFC